MLDFRGSTYTENRLIHRDLRYLIPYIIHSTSAMYFEQKSQKHEKTKNERLFSFYFVAKISQFQQYICPFVVLFPLSGYFWKNVSFDPPKFNFIVIQQIKFRQITSLLRSAKISSRTQL